MKKLSVLIALLCACTLNAENYGLWVNDAQITDINCSFLNGQIVYSPTTNVLTIDNANDTTSYLIIDQSVTLCFVGNSSLAGIYQSNPADVYTITIVTEKNAKLTLTHESAFYVNDFIVNFKNCNFTLDNSFAYGITQATLFAGDITFENCSIADPIHGKVSEIETTGYYTITDAENNFVRLFRVVSPSPATPTENPYMITTKTYGLGVSSDVIIRPVAENPVPRSVTIRNKTASPQMEAAKNEAERIFAEEMNRMNITLPCPISAVVRFGEPSDFSDLDEVCLVTTRYVEGDSMPEHYPYYPHIGEKKLSVQCLYPLALANLGYQGLYRDEPCMTISLNPDVDYYYGLSPEGINSNQYDMITVILRGLVIGCGFQSSLAIAPNGALSIGKNIGDTRYFTIFDANLYSCVHPIEILTTSDGIYTFLDNKVYGPRNVQLHNDLSHCSDCTPSLSTLNTISYENYEEDSTNSPDLMEPFLYRGAVIRAITPLSQEILHGLGWLFDVAVGVDDEVEPCAINGSTTLYPNNNYAYNAIGGTGWVESMSCDLFSSDSLYTLGTGGIAGLLSVSFNSLPDNNWDRNPLNNNIMGSVRAETTTQVNDRTIRTVSSLPIEVPYKPNKPLCKFAETISDSVLRVNIDAFAGGSDQYIVTCTPTIPGLTVRDTIAADILNYTIDNLSASQMYEITIEGVNAQGKSTAVSRSVGQIRLPLTLHLTASTYWITYYFTENGSAATSLDISSVHITNLSGNLIQVCSERQNEQIDISGLTSNQVYLLTVTLTDGRTFSKQFIKR